MTKVNTRGYDVPKMMEISGSHGPEIVTLYTVDEDGTAHYKCGDGLRCIRRIDGSIQTSFN